MRIKPFKLERFFTIHEFSAEYQLCNSDCEAMTIGDLLALEDGAADRFNKHWLGYTESKGHPELRRDITSIYDNMVADDILVCAGAQEPIFLFTQAVLEKGDEVIIQFPCYQSVQSIPESMGCKVNLWTVRYDGAKPTFDIDELRSLITDKTKIIYLNSPHNPTGYHFSKEEQQAIVTIAREKGIIIFGDEVFREYEHDPKYKLPAFCDIYENAVSLGVMSKSYGLPGLRLGWLASKNRNILEKVSILKEYVTICTAAPSEFLSGVALRNRRAILDRNLAIAQDNFAHLDEFFLKYPQLFSWCKPKAGPITYAKINWNEDDMDFANRLIKAKSVLILPGEVFDYKGFFRLGFCRKEMPTSLGKFEEFVVEHLI